MAKKKITTKKAGIDHFYLERLDRSKASQRFVSQLGTPIRNNWDIFSDTGVRVGNIIEYDYITPWGEHDTYCSATLFKFTDELHGVHRKFHTFEQACSWITDTVLDAVPEGAISVEEMIKRYL